MMPDTLKWDFIGLDTRYRLADRRVTRRHYLDSAASTLALRGARQVADELLRHYANTHSELHFSARIVGHAYDWAHAQVLKFVQADPERHVAFFAGSGCTALLNRLARTLAARRPERDVVLVSLMEHHANDLPHRRHAGQVVHLPLTGVAPAIGWALSRRKRRSAAKTWERMVMGLSSVLVRSTRHGALVGRWWPDPRSCGGWETSPLVFAANLG